MNDLIKQSEAQIIDLVGTWKAGNINQRRELILGLFPDGLVFSEKNLFFEPPNQQLMQLVREYVDGLKEDGAGDGI